MEEERVLQKMMCKFNPKIICVPSSGHSYPDNTVCISCRLHFVGEQIGANTAAQGELARILYDSIYSKED